MAESCVKGPFGPNAQTLENQKAPMLRDYLMPIALRPARAQDFDYCKRLYFAGMKTVMEELHLDTAAQAVGFHEQWVLTQVRIITLDGSDVGWLQAKTNDNGLFDAQLFVDAPFQRRGLGTEIMRRLIADAAHANHAVFQAVVKTNPAVRLYEGLGFRITHEDDRKLKRERDVATPRSNR